MRRGDPREIDESDPVLREGISGKDRGDRFDRGAVRNDEIADRVGDADGSRGAGVEDGAEPHVARIRRRWRGPSGVRRLVQSPR